jgi:hypothetical protein
MKQDCLEFSVFSVQFSVNERRFALDKGMDPEKNGNSANKKPRPGPLPCSPDLGR